MSKNISIQQKGTAKNFSDVGIVKVDSLDSGSVEWVPYSERRSTIKKITVNNTYLPSSDNVDGYTAVFVRVPPQTELSGLDSKTGLKYTVKQDVFGNALYYYDP